ncbi:MAG: ATP-binding protein, partial [Selenomonadaceae bacterium]|nr:ATP-binding protein [Selenomonadaceae bacterium]
MSFVHVLDDNTINKIAAGEVVERPASVIKELVENAIDAHADRIEVEITAGGTSFMRVSDNGIGMSRQDAELAILRHATSKIVKVDDLLTIGTLGFRGEALPSIASVSRFTLTTRQAGDELGTEIKISGGSLPEIGETGCGIGTTIRVEDLFFNTPARKKFLKTNNTEGGKINEFIVKLAISNPQIAFKLI